MKYAVIILSGLTFLPANRLAAQDPISIIQSGITRVIRAFDLRIQRTQTSTIWLQEAEKILENAMSETELGQIADWIAATKNLYQDYYTELREVKSIVAGYYKIRDIARREEDILNEGHQAISRFSKDSHFSASELDHMLAVCAGILNASLRNLDQLTLAADPFTTQMTDQQRLSSIDNAESTINNLYTDLHRFIDGNALLSLQRASDFNDYEQIKQLYGL